jgi:hypothetical protein
MDSPEWHKAWQGYGETLLCRYAEHENAALHESLRKKERCIAQQGTPVAPPTPATPS